MATCLSTVINVYLKFTIANNFERVCDIIKRLDVYTIAYISSDLLLLGNVDGYLD